MFGFALRFRGVGRGVARCLLAALAGQLVPAQGKASHAIDPPTTTRAENRVQRPSSGESAEN